MKALALLADDEILGHGYATWARLNEALVGPVGHGYGRLSLDLGDRLRAISAEIRRRRMPRPWWAIDIGS